MHNTQEFDELVDRNIKRDAMMYALSMIQAYHSLIPQGTNIEEATMMIVNAAKKFEDYIKS